MNLYAGAQLRRSRSLVVSAAWWVKEGRPGLRDSRAEVEENPSDQLIYLRHTLSLSPIPRPFTCPENADRMGR